MPRFTDFFTDFEKKYPTVLQSRIVESTRNAFISFNSEINFVQFLYKNVQLTNKIVFAFNKKIRSTFVKYAPSGKVGIGLEDGVQYFKMWRFTHHKKLSSVSSSL